MSEVQLYLGDCLEIMKTLPDNSVDAVVTDPPYGIGYASNRTTALNGGKRKNQASFGRDIFDPRWIPLAYRIQQDDSILYCFTRWDVLHLWRDAFEDAGYATCQRLVWDKCHWKMGDLRYYGSQLEDVLVLRKGAPTIFAGGSGRHGNMFRQSSAFLPEGQFDHPTQKPENLLRIFISDSTKLGDTVLDPFMGSGTTGVACIQTGRSFIGIEIDPTYFSAAKDRIVRAQMQPSLGL
jgi:site-specific DNA-methyltransferase (adenine-specific)